MNPTEDSQNPVTDSREPESTVIDVKTSSNNNSGNSVEISEDGTFSSASPGSTIVPESVETKEQDTPKEDTVTEKAQGSEEVETSPDEITQAPANDAENFPEEHSQDTPKDQNPMAIPPQPIKKSGKPKVAIVVAILIVVALIGVSVMAYLKMQDDNKVVDKKTPTPTESAKQEVAPLTQQEIDAAATELEAEINKTDDTKDLPTATSISDQSLGL